MRRFVILPTLFVCLLALQAGIAQSITLNEETTNDTPACTANGSPSYCQLPTNGVPALPFLTSSANQNPGLNPPVQTVTADAFPAHVSDVQISKLMPNVSGQPWAGKVLCEYQPWFSLQSGYNGHKDLDYDENQDSSGNPFPSAAPTQDSAMIAEGCNINFVDYYGNVDSSFLFNRQTTDNVYQDLANRLSSDTYPLQFAVMEDQGSFDSTSSPYCRSGLTEAATISCIEGYLKEDMDYIYAAYISQNPGLYWTDQGVNVVGYFGNCETFTALTCNGTSTDDWSQIWGVVEQYVASKNYNMKFIFQYGHFGYPSGSQGQYTWPQPYVGNGCTKNDPPNCFTSNPQSEFWWCDTNGKPCDGEGSGSGSYLDDFYTDAATYVPEGQVAVGLLYKGFDDSNAGWGTDRVIAQQCGQVLIDTGAELTAEAGENTSYWASHLMPYMQVATWNDYEEGTEVESGVNNCYTITSASTTSKNITWQLTASDATYANLKTIDHFNIWWSAVGATGSSTIQVAATNIANTATSYPLSGLTLPTPSTDGVVDLYVEMVGKPLVQNQWYGPVRYAY